LSVGEVVTGKGVSKYSETVEEVRERNLCFSDILYFMNALFPQSDVATGYSNNDYLKVGGVDALSFSDANTLENEHKIV